VEVLLVRHGLAGSKARWKGDDRDRPLSPKGVHQAQWLAGVLVPLAPTRIFSSPYLRCRQSVEPTAEKLGLPVTNAAALVPAAGHEAIAYVKRLGRSRERSMIVCTHGEVIAEVLAGLAIEAGKKLRPKPPGQKGGLWVMDLDGNRLVRARYTPPG
jgi:8-oxo-(d)GTP phosphatase